MTDLPSAASGGPTREPGRRGPLPILTLAAFAGLILGAMGLVLLLVSLARYLQGAV